MGNTNYWFIKTFVKLSCMCTLNYKKLLSQTITIFFSKVDQGLCILDLFFGSPK